MGIVRGNREVIGIHRHGRAIMEVRKYIDGAWRSVWRFIRSCFGAGYWVNKEPWLINEGWNNNNNV